VANPVLEHLQQAWEANFDPSFSTLQHAKRLCCITYNVILIRCLVFEKSLSSRMECVISFTAIQIYTLNSICVTVGIHYRSRLVVELLQVPHVSWGRMPSTTVQWSKSKLAKQERMFQMPMIACRWAKGNNWTIEELGKVKSMDWRDRWSLASTTSMWRRTTCGRLLVALEMHCLLDFFLFGQIII
jgi:hypothetical protein